MRTYFLPPPLPTINFDWPYGVYIDTILFDSMPYLSHQQLKSSCDELGLKYNLSATRKDLMAILKANSQTQEHTQGQTQGGKTPAKEQKPKPNNTPKNTPNGGQDDEKVDQFIGIHMLKGKAPSLSTQLVRLVGLIPELDSVQIFTHGPSSYAANKFDPELAPLAKTLGIRLHVHGSYLCVPWNGKPKSINHTIDNFRIAHKYGAWCVVLHMPKATVDDIVNGIKPIVAAIKKEQLSPYVMLEMKSIRPHPEMSMESPAKLNRLTRKLIKMKMGKYVRICIDTAHIDAGLAPIRTFAEGKKYIRALDDRLIGMIQLNGNGYDSSKRAGDKHEVPLSKPDCIWGGMPYTSTGCKAFIDYAMIRGIDVIMEVKSNHSAESIRAFVDKIV